MEFEEILAILLGWMGLELEVSVHGANGAEPLAALEARGQLRRGDEFGTESASPASIVFVLASDDGAQSATIRLYERSYAGGGWYDDEEEVLEVRSGVIQILLAPTEGQKTSGPERNEPSDGPPPTRRGDAENADREGF